MSLENWVPRTELGKAVAEGRITSIDEIFASGKKIKESEIVDKLLRLQTEIILVGSSSGKGGGKRRTPTKRTTRMHRSGRRYTVSAVIAVGNGDGYLGIGKAHSLENRKAIEKATENAKLNIIPIKRGCGSWECACGSNHSIPYEVSGKKGSVRVVLKPAPKGIGLCISDEAKKLMHLVGIRDVWSKSFGATSSRNNFVLAILDALKKINMVKIKEDDAEEKAQESKEAVEEDTEDLQEETIEKNTETV